MLAALAPYKACNCVVAYSGGLDSQVLLTLLKQLQPKSLRAIHINHQLQAEANDWAKFCEDYCKQNNISINIIPINLNLKKGDSLEAVAREARYNALFAELNPDELLLTAHHQDDQAETFLLQLMRGAGIKGLSCMPEMTNANNHARPLLRFTKTDFFAFAKQHQLNWIEDKSNQNLKFDRNFIRHQIIPLLQSRWSGVVSSIARSAEHCAEAQNLLDQVAADDYKLVKTDAGVPPGFMLPNITLDLVQLSLFSLARKNNLIRYWLRQLNLSLPSAKQLALIHQTVIHAGPKANPLLAWPGVQIRRYRNKLFAMPTLPDHDVNQVIEWDGQSELILPSACFKLTPLDSQQLAALKPPLTLGFRQPGQKLHFPGSEKHKKYKNTMQEANIPPWLRDRLPLVFAGEQFIMLKNN